AAEPGPRPGAAEPAGERRRRPRPADDERDALGKRLPLERLRVLAQGDAEPEQPSRQAPRERDCVGERRVGAEIDDLPAVAAKRDGGAHQAELVPLARRAEEYRGAAHAAARVAEQMT